MLRLSDSLLTLVSPSQRNGRTICECFIAPHKCQISIRKIFLIIKFSRLSVHQPKQIEYSEKYQDGKYEYRHVLLPEALMQRIPQDRLLTEMEWRQLGVQQSYGWQHYMKHRPEKHILLFRRVLGTVQSFI